MSKISIKTLFAFAGIALLSSAASAQQSVASCTLLGQATSPAPVSGSITIGNLDKYNYPAKTCMQMTSSPAGINLNYAAAFATTYSAASFSASCVGIPYQLNGGPIHTLMSVNGIVKRSPTGGFGTFQGTSYLQADQLTLIFAGQEYTISTGVIPLRMTATLNADQSSDATMCTPPGGIPATICVPHSLEEDPEQKLPCIVLEARIPNSVWSCLAVPTIGNGNVRMTYVEGC